MADEFDTDKGVKDDFVGEITDAFFKVNEQGATVLALKKKAEDGDEPEDYYAVGNEWASYDGGETVEHATKSKLHAQSQLAILVERAMASGAEDVIRQRSAENGSLGQRTAKLWPGLIFHWTVDEKPYSFTDRETGEERKGTSYKSYPDKFLGVADGSSPAAASSTGSSTPGDNEAAVTIPPEVFAKLKILAQSKPFPEWVDEALTVDWMRENMLSALGDEALYNSLKEQS